jgi:hypothetical protein
VTIEDLAAEIEAASRQFRFIQASERLDATTSSVKYRLVVAGDLHIQIYANLRNGTCGLALIHQGRRLHGRDTEDWLWNRHPAEDPESHDFSAEGARRVTIEEFPLEAGQVLLDQGLI